MEVTETAVIVEDGLACPVVVGSLIPGVGEFGEDGVYCYHAEIEVVVS